MRAPFFGVPSSPRSNRAGGWLYFDHAQQPGQQALGVRCQRTPVVKGVLHAIEVLGRQGPRAGVLLPRAAVLVRVSHDVQAARGRDHAHQHRGPRAAVLVQERDPGQAAAPHRLVHELRVPPVAARAHQVPHAVKPPVLDRLSQRGVVCRAPVLVSERQALRVPGTGSRVARAPVPRATQPAGHAQALQVTVLGGQVARLGVPRVSGRRLAHGQQQAVAALAQAHPRRARHPLVEPLLVRFRTRRERERGQREHCAPVP